MGRYLKALALMERGEPKKPKIPVSDSSLGLLGTPPPCIQKNEGVEAGGILGSLGTPPPSFKIIEVVNDDRRWCSDCTNLTEYGYCKAAERGEIDGAGRVYSPWQGLPRRCESFIGFN